MSIAADVPSIETRATSCRLDEAPKKADKRPEPMQLPNRTARAADVASYAEAATTTDGITVYVVDADAAVREAMLEFLEGHGYAVKDFADSLSFLKSYRTGGLGCLLVDAAMPTMGGTEVIQHLRQLGSTLPAIVMSGDTSLPLAVRAMKVGAADFIEKPVTGDVLLSSIRSALDQAGMVPALPDFRAIAKQRLAMLTTRQHEILDLVLAGHPSKNIAADLGISQRTVENHRAAISRKTCSKSMSALIRTALCAACSGNAQRERHSDGAGTHCATSSNLH